MKLRILDRILAPPLGPFDYYELKQKLLASTMQYVLEVKDRAFFNYLIEFEQLYVEAPVAISLLHEEDYQTLWHYSRIAALLELACNADPHSIARYHLAEREASNSPDTCFITQEMGSNEALRKYVSVLQSEAKYCPFLLSSYCARGLPPSIATRKNLPRYLTKAEEMRNTIALKLSAEEWPSERPWLFEISVLGRLVLYLLENETSAET